MCVISFKCVVVIDVVYECFCMQRAGITKPNDSREATLIEPTPPAKVL